MIYHQFQASARKSNLYSIHKIKELGMTITLLQPMNTIVSLLPRLANPSKKKKKKTFFNTGKPKANHSAIATQNTKVDHPQPQTKFHEQLKWRKNSILEE